MANRLHLRLMVLALALLGGAAGCTMGRLYSYTTVPYRTDFDRTPVGSKRCAIVMPRLQEPASGYNVSVQWLSQDTREAARAAGITNICYADREVLSVLFDIYRRDRVWLHGD